MVGKSSVINKNIYINSYVLFYKKVVLGINFHFFLFVFSFTRENNKIISSKVKCLFERNSIGVSLIDGSYLSIITSKVSNFKFQIM